MDVMRLYNAEQLLLNLICEKDVYKCLEKELSEGMFSEGLHRKLARIIINQHSSNAPLSSASVISQFTEEEVPDVAKILSDDKNVDDKKAAAKQSLEIIKQINSKKEEQRLAESGDIDSLQEMINQLKKAKG